MDEKEFEQKIYLEMRNGVKQESSTLHNFIIKFFTGLKKRSNALPQALETLYPILQKNHEENNVAIPSGSHSRAKRPEYNSKRTS